MNIHLKNLISDLSSSLISVLNGKLSYYNFFQCLKDDLENNYDESLKNDAIFKKLNKKTTDLWITLWNLTEDDDGYPYKSIPSENLKEIKKEILNYLIFFETLYDENWLSQLRQNTDPLYFKDIQLQLQKIINNEIQSNCDIDAALNYWQDIIPQKLITDSLLVLKFIYLYKKAEKQLGLPFPDKLEREIKSLVGQ